MITWDMSQLRLSSRCKLKGECATRRAVITRFGHYVKSTSKLGAIPGVLVCTVFTAFMHACVWLSVCRLPPFTYSVEMSNSYNTFRLYWSPWGNESSAFNPIQTHNYTDTQNLTWAAWGRNRGICRLSLIVISLPTSCHWPTSPGGGTCLPFVFGPFYSKLKPALSESASAPISMSCSHLRAPSHLTIVSPMGRIRLILKHFDLTDTNVTSCCIWTNAGLVAWTSLSLASAFIFSSFEISWLILA